MNATVKEALVSQEIQQLKERLKATWSTGDYDAFSRLIEKDAAEFFRKLGVAPGTRLLDVGCGAGQLASEIFRTSRELPWLRKGVTS